MQDGGIAGLIGMQRLIEYIARCPFSLARMVSLTKDGKINKDESDTCQRKVH